MAQKEVKQNGAQKGFSLSGRDGYTAGHADQADRSTSGPSTAGGCSAGAADDGVRAAAVVLCRI